MAIQYATTKSEGYDLAAEREAYAVALEELLAAKAGGVEVRTAPGLCRAAFRS